MKSFSIHENIFSKVQVVKLSHEQVSLKLTSYDDCYFDIFIKCTDRPYLYSNMSRVINIRNQLGMILITVNRIPTKIVCYYTRLIYSKSCTVPHQDCERVVKYDFQPQNDYFGLSDETNTLLY